MKSIGGDKQPGGYFMGNAVSIYIDLMRFLAAVTVFLSHLTEREFNSVFPWVSIGGEAVIIFFVISGYVIAYVLQTRENSVVDYASARLARLYSVVIPALVITVILDFVGRAVSPSVYSQIPSDYPFLRMLINAIFLNQIWNFTISPLSNGPYWSLGYEFWYYAIFGAWSLLHGKQRVIFTALLCMIAGPRILAEFPLWLVGVLVFNAARKFQPSVLAARVIFFLSLICLLSIVFLGNPLDFIQKKAASIFVDGRIHLQFGSIFLGDIPSIPKYAMIAMLFALTIFYVESSRLRLGSLTWLIPVIRYLAGSTFSIYLFHAPVLYFLQSVMGNHRDSAMHIILVGLLDISCCILLTYIGERQLKKYRYLFTKIIGRIWPQTLAAQKA